MNIDIGEHAEGAVLLTGFDDCIIGITEEFGGVRRVLYSRDKMLIKLQEDMTEEEAMEYYDYNILGLFVNDQNPIFLTHQIEDTDD